MIRIVAALESRAPGAGKAGEVGRPPGFPGEGRAACRATSKPCQRAGAPTPTLEHAGAAARSSRPDDTGQTRVTRLCWDALESPRGTTPASGCPSLWVSPLDGSGSRGRIGAGVRKSPTLVVYNYGN